MTTAAPSLRARAQLTDVAGTFGAVVAAMCCAGTPFIIAAVAAVGLSALRKDAILWPVMLAHSWWQFGATGGAIEYTGRGHRWSSVASAPFR